MQTGMPRPSAAIAQQLQQRQQQQMANRVQRTRPAMPQPQFNVPNPIQAPMQPQAGSFFQPPVTAQNPVGGFQMPPASPTPPVDAGNFGTIQDAPMPISGVAMPTPNPVPMPIQQPQTGMPSIGFGPAPALPDGMANQFAPQSGGMNNLPGIGIGFGPAPVLPGMPQMVGGPADLQFDQFGNPLPQ
jgi:hypothetical protein